MATWLEQLENELSASENIPLNKKNNSILQLIVIGFLIVSSILFFDYKQKQRLNNYSKNPHEPMLSFLNFFDNYRKDHLETQSKISDLNVKVRLMGIVVNQNSEVARRNLPSTEYVHLTPDWKLSKTPSCLKLTDKDKESLKDYIKQN